MYKFCLIIFSSLMILNIDPEIVESTQNADIIAIGKICTKTLDTNQGAVFKTLYTFEITEFIKGPTNITSIVIPTRSGFLDNGNYIRQGGEYNYIIGEEMILFLYDIDWHQLDVNQTLRPNGILNIDRNSNTKYMSTYAKGTLKNGVVIFEGKEYTKSFFISEINSVN